MFKIEGFIVVLTRFVDTFLQDIVVDSWYRIRDEIIVLGSKNSNYLAFLTDTSVERGWVIVSISGALQRVL